MSMLLALYIYGFIYISYVALSLLFRVFFALISSAAKARDPGSEEEGKGKTSERDETGTEAPPSGVSSRGVGARSRRGKEGDPYGRHRTGEVLISREVRRLWRKRTSKGFSSAVTGKRLPPYHSHIPFAPPPSSYNCLGENRFLGRRGRRFRNSKKAVKLQ